jgi:chemotaxis protein CheD
MDHTGYSTHYLLPAALFVTRKPYLVSTVLGSCVSVCLWDSKLGYGGINHFVLPLWDGKELASPKYGNIAITKLYERMLGIGCDKENLIAKIFGGGDILQTTFGLFNIGEKNVKISRECLMELNIRISKANVGGFFGRKIIFDTQKGIVKHRFLEIYN